MKDILVITSCSSLAGYSRQYIHQLSSAGIAVYLPDIPSDTPGLNAGFQFASRIQRTRMWANQFSEYKWIFITDAFDVFFYGDRQELLSRLDGVNLLFGAEKNCYPEPHLAPAIVAAYPERGEARYVNGGLSVGTPGAWRVWCDEVEHHSDYSPNMIDQQFLNRRLSEGSHITPIDWRSGLFFCLFGGYPELQFENGKPYVETYGTKPLFIHANGKWDQHEMLNKYEGSL
jgi:hypothetical protein